MLKTLRIENFRGFSEHTIELERFSVLVGENNAGKSTVVEALRFISIVTQRYKSLKFQRPPPIFSNIGARTGIAPSTKNLAISFRSLTHRYSSSPAIITATFENGISIQVYLSNSGDIFACIKTSEGLPIRNLAAAKQLIIPKISIMPQIGPLRKEEEPLTDDYVRSAADSHLSSLHFRNHFRVFDCLHGGINGALEETWPSVKLQKQCQVQHFPTETLSLEVRSEDFVGEIGLMGHGLQMWIQTLAFLCRSSESETVILDEPDVYMHADMQRRLVRYLRGRFPQVLLTTHSAEIMAEVDASEVIVVNRKLTKSSRCSDDPAVQTVLDRIGSVSNLHLARLWTTKRLLIFEGYDISYLKVLQNALFPESDTPIDAIPNLAIGGWGGWNLAIGSKMVLSHPAGGEIHAYCLLDRDYHSDSEIQCRYQEAARHNVRLHIWSKKEIENYALVPSAIRSLIVAKMGQRTSPPTLQEIEEKLSQFANEFEYVTLDGYASELLKQDRNGGLPAANRKAREILERCRISSGSIVDLTSGKELISRMSEWSKKEFNVSLSAMAIFRAMRTQDIHREVSDFLYAIEHCTEIPNSCKPLRT